MPAFVRYFPMQNSAMNKRYGARSGSIICSNDTYNGVLEYKNIWICGDAVNTDFVYSLYGEENVYAKRKDRFFDGYKGQRCILIRDLDKPFMKKCGTDMLLSIGDRYPKSVQVRGSWIHLFPKDYELVVTSKYKPEEIVDYTELGCIRRRFCVISMPYKPTRDGD